MVARVAITSVCTAATGQGLACLLLANAVGNAVEEMGNQGIDYAVNLIGKHHDL